MRGVRMSAAVLASLVLLGGCSSSGGGSSPTTASAPASSSGDPTATALANKMRAGLKGLQSAHIQVDAGELGGTSSGDVSYDASGAATASDITVGSGADQAEVVTVGAKTYAKLPAGRNTSGKPWVLVTPSSTNEFVRALASSVDISKAAASLPAIADVTATATSVQDKGANHYALSVDPARSSGSTLGSLLSGIGQKSVPVDLYLDGEDRPTKIVITVKLGTQSLPVTIAVSKFDAPLHITAPPPDQVAQ